MVLEFMYPEEVLYGDRGNMEYLARMFPEADIVRTGFGQEPAFVKGSVDFLYFGPMTEANLAKATEELLPHRDRLKGLMEDGCHMLVVNSALEMFGQSLELATGEKLKTLDLLPFKTQRNLADRHSSAVLGTSLAGGFKVMGYDARFGWQTGNEDMAFLSLERGQGFAPGSPWEGVHYKNFLGTNLLGPILILNPPLARALKKSLVGQTDLPFEVYGDQAYADRLAVFLNSPEIINQ